MNTKPTSNNKIPETILKGVLQMCQEFNKSKNNSFETFFEKIMNVLRCYPLWEIGYDEEKNKIFELREFISIGQEEILHKIHNIRFN